jgi:hypothetical protein
MTSGDGLPKIAERMEYSRLAASDPKGKDGVSIDVLKRGSVGAKTFMTVNRHSETKNAASAMGLRIPDEAFGVGA